VALEEIQGNRGATIWCVLSGNNNQMNPMREIEVLVWILKTPAIVIKDVGIVRTNCCTAVACGQFTETISGVDRPNQWAEPKHSGDGSDKEGNHPGSSDRNFGRSHAAL